ncbi:MAG: citrate synthase [Gemmatimonadota bacterium]|nr:citrate synthase [Gemmatimonadota bacterium]MDP6802950.1 citrate synthase [Gemmatimonadota bacterium]MDP7031247.1 citrate synthase [Gemmatimonadota bacterium]
MSQATSPTTFVPGLAGVIAAQSHVGFVDGENGILEYRGIRIENLAEHSTFEETCFLLLYGKLPTRTELTEFEDSLCSYRTVAPQLLEMIRAFPRDMHPMCALQTAVAAMGLYHPRTGAVDAAQRDISARRIIAQAPTLLAAIARRMKGLGAVAPREDLSHAANFLYMLNAEEPAEVAAHALDVALILHAEHTQNASTFTCRVVSSSLADPYAAVSAGLGSLGGPLHGGANERVLDMLDEIGEPENARAWLEDAIATKKKIMGLGHRVYKVKDPRAYSLQKLATRVFEELGSTKLYDIASEVEAAAAEKLGPKGIYPNVDFFSGTVYLKMGFETVLFTPIFGVARVAGYLAHYCEQMQDNRIFRPRQDFLGEHDVAYTPMADR